MNRRGVGGTQGFLGDMCTVSFCHLSLKIFLQCEPRNSFLPQKEFLFLYWQKNTGGNSTDLPITLQQNVDEVVQIKYNG